MVGSFVASKMVKEIIQLVSRLHNAVSKVCYMAKGCMAVTRDCHPQNANNIVSGESQIYGSQTTVVESMGNQWEINYPTSFYSYALCIT